MKLVLGSILRLIGWQKLLEMAWDIVDDDIKAKVTATAPHWDDDAFKVMDEMIKKLTSESL